MIDAIGFLYFKGLGIKQLYKLICYFMQRIINSLQAALRQEIAAGTILMVAALLAVLVANSPWAAWYSGLLDMPLSIGAGNWQLEKSLLHWVNDGLMAVFFLLVALEIKRELIEGALSTRKQALLPLITAVGGVLCPALIYIGMNYENGEALRGWAIPCATDIAFSLGVLAMVGSRVPMALKVFLTAVAVVDDLIAIIIIAIFYAGAIAGAALAAAGLCMALLLLMERCRVRYLTPYLVIGVMLWLAVLQSGIHATIAGVILGLCIPFRSEDNRQERMLIRLQHALHPWVTYGILPVFAFANAGVSFSGLSLHSLAEPIPLGIAVGLFFGKQLGICGSAWLAHRLGIAHLPAGVSWLAFYATAVIAGIGFTMSLFIGALAFADAALITEVRMGVLLGSLVSAVTGYFLLRYALRR